MTNNLKPIISLFFAYFLLQICPSQAADKEMQKKSDRDNHKKMCVETEKSSAELEIPIPPVARGHEAIYERFLKSVLIYKPNKESDEGRINLPIADLANPLEGTFDISKCGDTGKYLSILTGYRKGKKEENASKVEVWIAPRFLIERELNTTAAHFKPIMDRIVF